MMQHLPPSPELTVPALYAKIHRATVTCADLHYEGSLTIDSHLLELAGLKPYQGIDIYDITNGQRISTYIIKGEAHSGTIQVNGAAAHLIQPGNLIIIAAYCQMPMAMLTEEYQPTVVLCDAQNRPTHVNNRPILATV
jgi:aspartate 1-decarboxylase